MRHQRRQVGLRAAGEEQASLLAGALGHHRLQAQHGRVVTPDIVADLGRLHCPAHGLGRARDSVAAQINHDVGSVSLGKIFQFSDESCKVPARYYGQLARSSQAVTKGQSAASLCGLKKPKWPIPDRPYSAGAMTR